MKFKLTSKKLLKDKKMDIRKCFKCGLNDDGTEEHKGFFHRAHVLGRGSNPHLKNDFKNVVFLCGLCHIAQTNGVWGFCYDRECAQPADRRFIIFGKPKFCHQECYEKLLEAGKI